MKERRVVVTGLGLISPLGSEVKTTWSRLLEGESGIQTLVHLPSEMKVRIGGLCELDPLAVVTKKDLKKMDRFILLALWATKEALKSSGLEEIDEKLSSLTGSVVGVGIGGLPLMEEQAKLIQEGKFRQITSFFIPAMIGNLAAGQISIFYKLKGPSYSITSACASGSHSLGESYLMIKQARCEMMISGGAEACLTPLAFSGFASMRALSTNPDPKRASRPWDKARDGFVMSEGAGILILEELERAKKRDAPIYAELVGYGASSDGYHMTNPSREGAVLAMKKALDDAKVSSSDIDLINAHSTSTPAGDMSEASAISEVFGDKKVLVHSTKGMIGHTLGAAGAIESAVSVMSLKEGKVHPNVNLEEKQTECRLNLVGKDTEEHKIKYVLKNSFGFGGTNVSLVFKKWEAE